MSQSFDVIVIGAGPGGYIAAIRCAQLGLKVACIDAWSNQEGAPAPGGTCTNVGCIPSKALLQSSEHYEHATHHLGDHGVEVKGVGLNLPAMLSRKNQVVAQNNQGILYLFKKNKVSFFHGTGAFVGAAHEGLYSVQVTPKSAKGEAQTLTAKHVIVATGSSARELDLAPFDEERILSNDGALQIPHVPKKLTLIGSGVIGLEMGSVWRRLGAEVTVLEGLPDFLGAVDEQVAKEAYKILTQQGLNIELGVKVTAVSKTAKAVTVSYTNAKGEEQSLTSERLIVSIGRIPNTQGLGSRQWAWPWMKEAPWSWTSIAARHLPTSGPWVMWCEAPCSRTKQRRKALLWPSALPDNTATSTSIPFPG